MFNVRVTHTNATQITSILEPLERFYWTLKMKHLINETMVTIDSAANWRLSILLLKTIERKLRDRATLPRNWRRSCSARLCRDHLWMLIYNENGGNPREESSEILLRVTSTFACEKSIFCAGGGTRERYHEKEDS